MGGGGAMGRAAVIGVSDVVGGGDAHDRAEFPLPLERRAAKRRVRVRAGTTGQRALPPRTSARLLRYTRGTPGGAGPERAYER